MPARLTAILAAAAALAAGFAAAPATAQSVSDVARAQAGHSCPSCNLFQAQLNYVRMANRDFKAARLTQASLIAGVFDRSVFEKADLSFANLAAGRFTRADFAGANLTQTNFVGAYVGYADFHGAQLDGANLSGTNLKGVRNLTQAQLDGACGDASTLLPKGLTIATCAAIRAQTPGLTGN